MKTHRTQILLEPQEYQQYARLARQRGTSLAALFREAMALQYAPAHIDANSHLDRLVQLRVPLGDWEDLAKEIAEAKDGGFS